MMFVAVSPWLVLPVGTAHAKPKTPGYPEQVVQWTVGEGETCGDIAVALYGAARHAHLIERYSAVKCRGSLVLKPGTTLVVPAEVTSLATAEVQSLKPEVRAKPPGGGWETAAPGMSLHQRYSVNTREAARADIRFIDRTRIFLSERTLVVIYGTARQSQVAQTKELTVELDSGELQAGLAAIAGRKIEIGVVGGGRVSAESKDAVLRKAKKRTTVSVFDGSAEVTSAGRRVVVPKDHGSAFVEKAPPSAAQPLPPPPSFQPATSPLVVLAAKRASDSKGGGLIRAAWSAIPRAKAYRVELSTDAQFHELVVREEVGADILNFRAENMPPGRYYLRVRAIDVDDFLGIASLARPVSVVEVQSDAKNTTLSSASIRVHRYQRLRFNAPPGLEVSLDDGDFGKPPKQIDFGLVTPKRLRFRGVGEQRAQTFEVTYQEPQAKATLERLESGAFRLTTTFPGIDAESVTARMQPRLKVVSALNQGEPVPFEESVALSQVAGGSAEASYQATIPALAVDHLTVMLVDARGRGLGQVTWDAPGKAAVTPLALRQPELLVGAPMRGLHPAVSTRMWSPSRRSTLDLTGSLATDGTAQLAAEVSGSTGRGGALPQLGFDALLPTNGLGDSDNTQVDRLAWLGASVELLQPDAGRGSFGVAARIGLPTVAGAVSVAELGLGLGHQGRRWSWLTNLGGRVALAPDSGRESGQAFWLLGGGYGLTDFARLYALLDLHLLLGDESLVPSGVAARGGLGAGLEFSLFAPPEGVTGDELFVSAGGRASPWEELDHLLLFQLGAGYRGF